METRLSVHRVRKETRFDCSGNRNHVRLCRFCPLSSTILTAVSRRFEKLGEGKPVGYVRTKCVNLHVSTKQSII